MAEEQPALVQGTDAASDYVLAETASGVWITVDNVSVHIWRSPTSDQVIVEAFPLGHEVEDRMLGLFIVPRANAQLVIDREE